VHRGITDPAQITNQLCWLAGQDLPVPQQSQHGFEVLEQNPFKLNRHYA